MAIISKVLGSHKRLKVLSPLWLNRLKIYACDMIKKVVNTFIILINGTLSFLLLSDDDGGALCSVFEQNKVSKKN